MNYEPAETVIAPTSLASSRPGRARAPWSRPTRLWSLDITRPWDTADSVRSSQIGRAD